jgi:lipoyl(octanoyl) transferase
MPEWRTFPFPADYAHLSDAMERHVAAMIRQEAGEEIWLAEFPPLYTAGSGTEEGDLLQPSRFPVHRTGRGGRMTYHGPGQRVAYAMIDLGKRNMKDVRRYVFWLEERIVLALAEFGIQGERREGRVGIWVRDERAGTEAKIAAVGVRLRKWIAFHGIAVNVAPNLEHFSGVVPCGIREHGVTSCAALGVNVTLPEFDAALKRAFGKG